MSTVSVCLLSLAMFTSICAMFHSDARRSRIIFHGGPEKGRGILSVLSWLSLAATFRAMGLAIGWELAVPVWMCLLCMIGVASLFIAALSQRWHLAMGVSSGFVALFGVVVATVSGLSMQ